MVIKTKSKAITLTAILVTAGISLAGCSGSNGSSGSHGSDNVTTNMEKTSESALALMKEGPNILTALTLSSFIDEDDPLIGDDGSKFVEKYDKKLKKLRNLYEKDSQYEQTVSKLKKVMEDEGINKGSAETLLSLASLGILSQDNPEGQGDWDNIEIDKDAFATKDGNLVPVKNGYLSFKKGNIYTASLSVEDSSGVPLTFNKNGTKLTTYNLSKLLDESFSDVKHKKGTGESTDLYKAYKEYSTVLSKENSNLSVKKAVVLLNQDKGSVAKWKVGSVGKSSTVEATVGKKSYNFQSPEEWKTFAEKWKTKGGGFDMDLDMKW